MQVHLGILGCRWCKNYWNVERAKYKCFVGTCRVFACLGAAALFTGWRLQAFCMLKSGIKIPADDGFWRLVEDHQPDFDTQELELNCSYSSSLFK